MCLPSNLRVKASNDGVNTRRLTGWIPWPLQHTSTQISVDFSSINHHDADWKEPKHTPPPSHARATSPSPFCTFSFHLFFYPFHNRTVRVNRHSGTLRGTAWRVFSPTCAHIRTHARCVSSVSTVVDLLTAVSRFYCSCKLSIFLSPDTDVLKGLPPSFLCCLKAVSFIWRRKSAQHGEPAL